MSDALPHDVTKADPNDSNLFKRLGFGQRTPEEYAKITRPQIAKAWGDLVKQWHPDQNGGDRSHEPKLIKINEAWDKLRNDADRIRYAESLKPRSTGSGSKRAGGGNNNEPRTFRSDYKNRRYRTDNLGWKFIDEMSLQYGGFAGKDLSHMRFDNCVFSRPGSRNVLTAMKLEGTVFDTCWFENAHFGPQQAPINNSFIGCIFKNARFDNAQFGPMVQFHMCDFEGADFRRIAGALPRIATAGSSLNGIKIHERHLPGLQRQPLLADIDIHVFDDTGASRTLRYDRLGNMTDLSAPRPQRTARTEEPPRARTNDRATGGHHQSDPHAGGSGNSRNSGFDWNRWNQQADDVQREGEQAYRRAQDSMNDANRFAEEMNRRNNAVHGGGGKIGWIIAGTAVVVGAIMLLSMGEERDNTRRRYSQRFPMPQPNPDWQARMQQFASLNDPSLLR